MRGGRAGVVSLSPPAPFGGKPRRFSETQKLLLGGRTPLFRVLPVEFLFLPSSYCFSEMAPVCAVVGGVLGQEVVKVVVVVFWGGCSDAWGGWGGLHGTRFPPRPPKNSVFPPAQALSQRDPPHNNFFFFDGIKGNGIVECLGPS